MNGFEKRTEEKKKSVLESAFALMNNDAGVKNLTIDDLVKEANVGKTTIFKYFGSKENIIHEVFIHFLNEMGDSAKAIMAQNKPFEETIIEMSQNKIRFLDKVNKQFYLDLMAYFTEKEDDGSTRIMAEYTKQSFDMMLDLFHRGRKEGKVDLKYSDEFLILYFQALVEGISNPSIYERILPYTEEWTELLVKGIAPNK
ncbi:TetR/AcrR family transcriptional regulator [Listeria fleischmannii]|uniref:TetR/AcrR family transcriptional regulator n=4 Tax=Listeria fleischmannii TaxID=1069827 RepID=A0A841YFZ9_9LIST|nr:TetR/AcrR family transcriptional regulator [Listeria fleischmannii]MBC1398997.1 TetR/AcrR family transcriptional regulator [Listeria fleischmannii]MBC1427250.1 TetR/AcrR family transcriptional regulator [Listeria fleischmannii]STY34666.1 transcriptional regulator BetI [Listeria fleischmannii subsp. coloradonensis]